MVCDKDMMRACIYGLAVGVAYGYEAIPAEWIRQLRGKAVIELCI